MRIYLLQNVLNKFQKGKLRFTCFSILLMLTSISTKASNYYWVGGTGNWSDFPNHWATTSGGLIFHTTIPSPTDDVYFDGNSFATAGDTIFLDATITNCNTMDWSTATNNPVLQGVSIWNYPLTIYGSLILNPNMKWNLNGYLNLNSAQANNVINTNGVVLYDSLSSTIMSINGTGSWNLLNDINAYYINITNGTFYSNNYTINCGLSCSLDSGHVYLGTSIVNGSFTGDSLVDADSTIIYGSVFGNDVAFNEVYNCEYLNTSNCTFNNVQCHKLDGSNNFFKNILFVDDSCGYFYWQTCNQIRGANNVFHKATIPCSYIDISDNQTFDSLLFNNPGQIIKLHNNTITINNSLEINGTCNGLSSLVASDAIITIPDTATISFPNGTFNFDYLYLQNIKQIGTGICTLNNSIDAGGNTGWIINSPSPRILYWVGGSGNWNDANHWASTSGGIGGGCVPNQTDSLFFDINSFSAIGDTVFVTAPLIYCRYMDWSTALNAPVFYCDPNYGSQLQVMGSIILNPNMVLNNFESIYLKSNATGNIIKTFGVNLNFNIWIEGIGNWDLQSDINVLAVNFVEGTFHSNNYNMNGTFETSYGISKNVSIFLGTSSVTGNGFNFYEGANIYVDGDSATFNVVSLGLPNGTTNISAICTGLLASSCTFIQLQCTSITGDNNSFQQVVFDSLYNYSSIFGVNNYIHFAEVLSNQLSTGFSVPISYTFDTLIFSIPGQTINFKNGDLLNINNYLSINGTCSELASLVCNSGTATINKNSGTVVFDYLLLQNISKTGGATFTANNSIDAGGNSGWIINSPPPQNLYWVGGTGDWFDINHWSNTSGGVGGACLPNQLNDVFFDANSFSNANDTIYDMFKTISFHSMDWSGVTNMPHLHLYGSVVNIFGSLILNPNMTITSDCKFIFKSTGMGNIINTFGLPLTSVNPWTSIGFIGTGSWELANDFTTNLLYFIDGTFKSNDFTINVGNINPSSQEINPKLYFGTSIINAGEINFLSNNTILHADSCKINAGSLRSLMGATAYNEVTCSDYAIAADCSFNYFEGKSFGGYGNVVQKVRFTDSTYSSIDGSNVGFNVFHKVIMPGVNCFIDGLNAFDTLVFSDQCHQIELGGNTVVNNYLQIQSNPSFPTSINCTNGFATITKPTDTVCTDNIYMNNIHATGGAVFYAGANSVDLGNNTGWIWTSCTPDTSNVWPGDANYDLTADNIDLLYVGLAYGYTGTTRAGATNNWVAQPSADWLQQFANGINIKQADCDGNGVVDANDTLAISLNYGQVHPLKISTPPQLNNFGTDLYFDMPVGALTPGTMVSIPINFGTALSPANNIYGIGFTINYDPTLVAANSMNMDVNNSWIGDATNTLNLSKDFPLNGTIDFGFTKTNHQNSSGNGTIATLNFTVANNASGYLNLSFSKILVLDRNEFPVPVNAQSSSIYTAIDQQNSNSKIAVYPNPASNQLNILLPEYAKKATVIVTNLTGKIVCQTSAIGKNKMELNISNYDAGIYFVQVQTDDIVATQKFVVAK